ncbi:MAG: hypothetical protein JRC86_00550 [Deltaproteobacteria bacterium]|nr:hypothetical protein [Deltaproteobacteria bacterium]
MDATYCWFISEDHIAQPGDKPGTNLNAVGVQGPSNAPQTIGEGWEVVPFRMYDDDGILYYAGMIMAEDVNSEEALFGPLDDFGTPNAGCTRIDILNDRTRMWETV